MKKIFFVLFYVLLSLTIVNADSNYESDYTLIDCVNWDNDTAVAFDNSMPYATLKEWIENTISYINSNINKAWNETSASWITLNIKVQCSFNDILNTSINLNYNWVAYNNELIIEWIEDNSLIFKEVNFNLWNKTGNIVFKNAQFRNETKPYFYDKKNVPWKKYRTPSTHPISNWIKIIDSYIQLKNFNNIWDKMNYSSYLRLDNRRVPADSLYNYSNKQIIENSIIDIEIDSNFDFRIPVFVKNSKINFTNINYDWPFNIRFIEDWNTKISTNLNYSVFVSNEIDLWWNHLSIENTKKISFLNNKINNFDNIDIDWEALFINNYFENNSSIDISNTYKLYNNIFKSGFTDTYDIMNYRKNYAENNVLGKWIGWIYKRIRDNKYFNIDISVDSLYKEVTGNDLPGWLWEIYVIFNY